MAIFNTIYVNSPPTTKYVWWSPHMTSANTPTPYVVTASDYINNTVPPYFAFDGDVSNWFGSNTPNTTWLQFDFATPQLIAGVSLTPAGIRSGYDYSKAFPKKFRILGSNDAIDYTNVFANDSDNEVVPVAYTPKEYKFKPVQFRFYKLQVDSEAGNWWDEYPNYTTIAEFQFYRPESEVTA